MPLAFRTSSFLGRRCAILLLVVASACSDLFGPTERVVTMDVAPQRVACVGEGPQECLRIRQHPDTGWTLFYGSIEGFQFVAGFEYTIRVATRTIANPPQDG